MKKNKVKPASGKLGVLIPGFCGAITTTITGGVEGIKKGEDKPIGSLTQMGRIRLGKRSEKRCPLIKDFVPLAELKDLVFGGWDIFNENLYEAARKASVLERPHIERLKKELSSYRPMKAVFDRKYVKNLNGSWVKEAHSKMHLAEMLREDIRDFNKKISWTGLL
ncbi:MAG: hypothetical protein Fur0012_12370 [Elusimicrobiota bacterium]